MTLATSSLASAPISFGGFGDMTDTTSDGPEQATTYVTFDFGAQTLAADVCDVREILDMQDVVPLPNAGMDLLGMIDVRGEGVAVLDLQSKLGLASDPSSPDRRIIVLEIGRQAKSAVGIIADRVRNVTEIAADQIEEAPSALGSWDSSVLEGVARLDGRLVYVLSFSKLLGSDLRGPFDFD